MATSFVLLLLVRLRPLTELVDGLEAEGSQDDPTTGHDAEEALIDVLDSAR